MNRRRKETNLEQTKEHNISRFRATAAASTISFSPRKRQAQVAVIQYDEGKPYFNMGDYV